MTRVIISGVRNQPFGSWPMAAETTDGVIWTNFSQPFDQKDFCTSIAYSATAIAVSNQRGYLSVTNDMVNWTIAEINDGFGTTGICQVTDSSNIERWVAVGSYNYINGYGPYAAKTQVAQIYLSENALSGWAMVFSHPANNSIFYQTAYFANANINPNEIANVILAVGADGYGNGMIYYSLDYGSSWTTSPVPPGVSTIFSVNVYQISGTAVWVWGTNGKIFTSSTLHDTVWTEINASNDGQIIQIAVENQNNIMVVVTPQQLLISFDGLSFQSFSQLGYIWSSVQFIPYNGYFRWIAFARSTLTQYTYWYSDDLATWIPSNNGIETQAALTQ